MVFMSGKAFQELLDATYRRARAPEKSEIPEVAPGLQPTVQPVEHLLPPAPNTSLHADAANEQDTRSGEDKGPKRRRAAMTQSLRWD